MTLINAFPVGYRVPGDGFWEPSTFKLMLENGQSKVSSH